MTMMTTATMNDGGRKRWMGAMGERGRKGNMGKGREGLGWNILY
jgi:hypothetical protein